MTVRRAKLTEPSVRLNLLPCRNDAATRSPAMNKITADAAIAFARQSDAVANFKLWNDSRLYLTISNMRRDFRGEAGAQTYIDIKTGAIVLAAGKGTVSSEWNARTRALRAEFDAAFPVA